MSRPEHEGPSADRGALVKEALAQIRDLRRQIEAAEQAAHEPIAIVGLGCRLPGADRLAGGALGAARRTASDAISEVPRDRWDVDAYYDPDPDAPGQDVYPARRLPERRRPVRPQLLRHLAARGGERWIRSSACCSRWRGKRSSTPAWPPERLFGIATGVFVGIRHERLRAAARAGRATRGDSTPISATGNVPQRGVGPAVVRARPAGPEHRRRHGLLVVARGRAPRVSGACARGSATGAGRRRQRSCSRPTTSINFSEARMLAPDGRCKTFDAAADGYVRGEGCGVVVLKRLRDALADGDRVLAVIRGTAVNQDGRSSGLTVPNGPAQEARDPGGAGGRAASRPRDDRLRRGARHRARRSAIRSRCSALGAVLGERPTGATRCSIGSVKTNIGHLEAAAGVAGLIKVVLALEHETHAAAPALRDAEPATSTGTRWPSRSRPSRARGRARRARRARRRQLVRLQRHERPRGASRRRRRRDLAARRGRGRSSRCRHGARTR